MSASPHTSAIGVRPPGHRLPDATTIGRVRLQVADLARSIDYYEHVIGLRTIERASGRATLGAHGDDAPIVALHEVPGVRAVPRRGRLGLFHFAILLPDRASLGRFVTHLSDTGARAGASDHFVSEALYLHDPDGLGIEVYVDRPRSEWRVRDGEIEMTTMPLDLASVARAGGGAPWTGMPAGTRIGHVHLSVSDIPTADAFFHAAVGFDRIVWSYPGALFMSVGGYHHHLGTNTWSAESPVATDDDARLLEWELLLPSTSDVDAVAASLTAAGHPVERDGGDAVVRDPWGTRVRFRAR